MFKNRFKRIFIKRGRNIQNDNEMIISSQFPIPKYDAVDRFFFLKSCVTKKNTKKKWDTELKEAHNKRGPSYSIMSISPSSATGAPFAGAPLVFPVSSTFPPPQ